VSMNGGARVSQRVNADFYVRTEEAESNMTRDSPRESMSATQDREEGVSVSRLGEEEK
jgi:hypothetical protein